MANRQDRPDRRSALQLLVTAMSFSGADSAVAAASAPSKWAGRWDDPDAPGCKREIVMNFDGTKGRLTGTESTGMNPGLCHPTGVRVTYLCFRTQSLVSGACPFSTLYKYKLARRSERSKSRLPSST